MKRGIAMPNPPLQPKCLPEYLFIPIALEPSLSALLPFLDTLPGPFQYMVETPQLAQSLNKVAIAGTYFRASSYFELAEKHKLTGNAAFDLRDRTLALKEYGLALDRLDDCLDTGEEVRNDEVYQRKVTKLKAVCLSNRAAAWMLEGEGMDVDKALKDGHQAEEADPSYVKSYVSRLLVNI